MVKNKMWLRSEEEVIKRIVANKTSFANSVSFALNSAFPYPEHQFSNDVMVSVNVPRAHLGLDPEQKPGDIDLLLIPLDDYQYHFDLSVAIEVKVVRPTIAKPSRNVNSMGFKQTSGLLRDGFPFVGLLHIAVPEAIPTELFWNVPVIDNALGPNGELVETGERVAMDPFPIITAQRQEGRINALGLPMEAGFNSIGLNLSPDGEGFSGGTVGFDKIGKPNPQVSKDLLEAIEAYLINNRESFSEVRWFDKSRR
ncbi:hypothetical protein [Marinobacter sp. CA1]|uniref:hypothetical protein n=1 Tax=Marinobacter sp. CA1 TaxID=2817656 RepID=UPI001D07A199|nr:hypothetical protein [Marinobacter sp. CA1]UDL05990.1 hypothetical protein J2887_04280 [Marinobacter sp. CA1]